MMPPARAQWRTVDSERHSQRIVGLRGKRGSERRKLSNNTLMVHRFVSWRGMPGTSCLTVYKEEGQ